MLRRFTPRKGSPRILISSNAHWYKPMAQSMNLPDHFLLEEAFQPNDLPNFPGLLSTVISRCNFEHSTDARQERGITHEDRTHFRCKTFSSVVGDFGCIPEIQALRQTLGHTCRLKTCIEAVLAVIAFHRFVCSGVPLARAPGTCSYAALAANTRCRFYVDDAIGVAPLDCTRRTHLQAPRLFAVETRHKHKTYSWHILQPNWSDCVVLTQSRTGIQSFIGLAADFAAQTAHTTIAILQQVIFAHNPIPLASPVGPARCIHRGRCLRPPDRTP